METNHRREFLKKSIMGVSAAAFIPASMKASVSSQNRVTSPLPTRKLGKTNIQIPVLSMGTGDTQNPALIKGVLESGVKLFATSSYYGNGNNETVLGEVFKTLPRDSYMVATSAMPKGTDHQNGLFTDATAAESFRADVEAGMKRLKVDYLDILFLPFAAKRESVFFEPLLRVMEDFKKQGKARYLGIATHSWVGDAVKAAADTKVYDVVMAAYNFNLGEYMQPVNEAIDYAAAAGLGIIAMKTMAGGFWDKERTKPINSKAALKWVLQNPNIHTLMSGMTTYDELLTNLALIQEKELTPEEMKDLKLASNEKTGLYCLQCHDCEGQCDKQVDIPTLMRSYMYAYGYRNLHHAKQTLEMANLSDLPCDGCTTCKVSCRAGFNIKGKIHEIARLADVPSDFLNA